MGWRLRLVLVSLSLAAGPSACDRAPHSFYPLNEDWVWRYRLVFETEDGRREQRYILRNGAEQTLSGRHVVPRITLDGNRYYYAENDAGVKQVGVQLHTDTEPSFWSEDRYELKYPLRPGTQWQRTTNTLALERTGPPQRTHYRITVPVELKLTIESVDQRVKVAAGTFHGCVLVRGVGHANADVRNYIGKANIEVETLDWYAPGTGLIKSVRREHTSSPALDYGEYRLELEALSR